MKEGGGLVATEQTGLYDEWRRARTTPGLHGLVDNQLVGSDYQERVISRMSPTGSVVRKHFGQGRVAYIPQIEFDGALPPPQPYFAITNIFWKRPRNWKEVIDSVHWAAAGNIPLTVDGPDFLVMNCTSQRGSRRVLVHLLNYNAGQVSTLAAIGFRVALPDGKKALKATLYAPEIDGPRPLQFAGVAHETEVTLPEMKTYAVISVEW